jgi:anti-anti-sigma factor
MQCRVSATGSGHRVTVCGEVDIATAPKLAETLVQFANGPVIVDLTDVTFFDASGVGALIAARRHIERRSGRLIVENTSAAVRRVFDIVGLDFSRHAGSAGSERHGADANSTSHRAYQGTPSKVQQGFSLTDWSTPSDAVSLIMSIPSRLVAALERAATRNSADGATAWPRDEKGWTALDHGVHVAEVLHATAKRLRLVFDQARPVLTPSPPEALPLATSSSLSVPIVRAALCTAAADLARLVTQAQPDEWMLSARRDNDTVNAQALLREALDDAQNHLDALEHAPKLGVVQGMVPEEEHLMFARPRSASEQTARGTA